MCESKYANIFGTRLKKNCSGIRFTIQLGSNTLNSQDFNRVTVRTNTSFLHPEFDDLTLQNDIGLIQLNEPVQFSGKSDSYRFIPI